MGNSVFIAKILGPYMVVAALGIMLNMKHYQKMMDDFLKNSAFLYLGGAMAFIIGMVIVLSHNVWIAGWQVIITIFGWGGIIKGIWLILFPRSAGKLTQIYQKKPALLVVHMIIILVFGILLTARAYLV